MVRHVVNLFYREFKGLHQAAYVLALFAFGSQILALFRDRALAHTFGASLELDLYYLAFRIPDVLYWVFAAMLSVYVLIPFVTRHQTNAGAKAAATLLSQVFTFFVITYAFFALLLLLLAPLFVPILFPALDAGATEQLVALLRILLVQPFLLGCSALMGVITQLRQRFIVYAISPILYNIGILFGILALYPHYGLYGLISGVIIGAIAHAAVQLPLVLKSELRFGFTYPAWRPIREIMIVAIPRAVTLSLHQVVLLVLAILAATMTIGSVSVFQFAFNLQSVPLAIIGVSYSVAAFPVLARLLADNELQQFKRHVHTAFRHIIFWSLPVIVLAIILRAHLVRVILGSGNFGWDDTRLTAAVFALFVLSLLAQAINLLTVRAFYASGDTRTPLLVTIVSSTITLCTAWFLYYVAYQVAAVRTFMEQILRLEDVGGTEVILLALAFSFGMLVQAASMMYLLQRVFPKIYSGMMKTFYQVSVASVITGLATYVTLNFIVKGINQETFVGIFLQGSIAGLVGILCAYITLRLLRSEELHEIQNSIRRRFSKRVFTSLDTR